MLFLFVVWLLAMEVHAAPTKFPTLRPTRKPTTNPAASSVSGWVFLTSYGDSSCVVPNIITGAPIDTCLYDSSSGNSFKYSCYADQPGIFTYTDSACLSPSPSFQYITTGCVAATRYQCATTYSLPLSSNYAVLYTYKENSCNNPISFTATANGNCNSDGSMYVYPNIRYYSNAYCTGSYSTQSFATCSSGKRMTIGGSLGAQLTYSPTAAPTPAVITLKGTMKISRIIVTSYSQNDKQALITSATSSLAAALNIGASYITDLYFTQLQYASPSTSSLSIMGIQFTLKGSIDYFRSQLNVISSLPSDVAYKVSSTLNTNSYYFMTSLNNNLYYNGASYTMRTDFQYYASYQATSTTVSTSSSTTSTTSSSSSSGGSSVIGVIIGIVVPVVIGAAVVAGWCFHQSKIRQAQVIPGNAGVSAPVGTNYPFNPATATASAYPVNSNIGPYGESVGMTQPYGYPNQQNFQPYSQPYATATSAVDSNTNAGYVNAYGVMIGGNATSSIPQQQQYGTASYNQASSYPTTSTTTTQGGFILPYASTTTNYGVPSGMNNMIGGSPYVASTGYPNQMNNANIVEGVAVLLPNNPQNPSPTPTGANPLASAIVGNYQNPPGTTMPSTMSGIPDTFAFSSSNLSAT